MKQDLQMLVMRTWGWVKTYGKVKKSGQNMKGGRI